MTDFSISIGKDGTRLLKRLQNLSTAGRMRDLLTKFFDRQGSLVSGRIVKNYLSGQRLGRRTGTLARSIQGRGVVERGLPGLRVGIFKGPALSYARILEQGGVIRPRNAKALAFAPKGSKALTPAGVDRYGGPRQFPGKLRFIPFRKSGISQGKIIGGLYDQKDLRNNRGEGLQNVKAIYLLAKEIKIEPRNFLSDGLRESIPQIGKNLAAFLKAQLKDDS